MHGHGRRESAYPDSHGTSIVRSPGRWPGPHSHSRRCQLNVRLAASLFVVALCVGACAEDKNGKPVIGSTIAAKVSIDGSVEVSDRGESGTSGSANVNGRSTPERRLGKMEARRSKLEAAFATDGPSDVDWVGRGDLTARYRSRVSSDVSLVQFECRQNVCRVHVRFANDRSRIEFRNSLFGPGGVFTGEPFRRTAVVWSDPGADGSRSAYAFLWRM